MVVALAIADKPQSIAPVCLCTPLKTLIATACPMYNEIEFVLLYN